MKLNRRDFLTSAAGLAGTLALSRTASSRAKTAGSGLTVQNVIDLILREIPGGEIENTVDTVKSGDPRKEVTGIVTTFLATSAVIRKAADRGANFVITHEPTFYNHLDETDWLDGDVVYEAKKRLLEDTEMVVWRFHDYWHRHDPDGVTTGVLRQLGWEAYADKNDINRCSIPQMPLRNLAEFLKGRLGTESVRIVGDPQMECKIVGLLMGAWGGRRQIEFLGRPDIDVLVCGEAREWETTEYVRDANEAGFKKGLVVVGHALSEEPGMSWLAEWLGNRVTGVSVTHIPTGDPFRYL